MLKFNIFFVLDGVNSVAGNAISSATAQADNWLGMGPVTIPAEGAALKFHYRGAVSQWKDGFDLYITEDGMEPYNDVDPGETDIAYSIAS